MHNRAERQAHFQQWIKIEELLKLWAYRANWQIGDPIVSYSFARLQNAAADSYAAIASRQFQLTTI